MADHGVERLEAVFNGGLQGKTVLILGLAYRGGVKESELSSALLAAEALRHRGARVLVHDPLFSDDEIRRHRAICLFCISHAGIVSDAGGVGL